MNTEYRENVLHNLDNGEIILNSFSCAFKNIILLQGFLFISTEALYFFSYFDDGNVGSFFSFGANSVTKIRIKYSEIEKVYKCNNDIIGIFDNSIKLKLNTQTDQELFLTSFLDRNGAFDLILRRLDKSEDTRMEAEDDELRSYRKVSA